MRYIFILLSFLLATSFSFASESSKIRASSMVLINEPRLPDANQFRTKLEERIKGRVKIDSMEADGKSVILLRVRGGTVMIGLIDRPIPKGQVDDLCQGAWYWSSACEDTSKHMGHIFVSVLDTNLDRLDTSLLLTDIIAVLMDSNAVASYWGASLQSREAFLKQSATASRSSPPVWLWMNFRISNDVKKGFSLSTQGMEEFDLREIEAKDVNRNGLEVFSLLLGTAQYLVAKGPVIKDGQTIGHSPSLNIRVRQGPSYWREGITVYRVIFPD